jgi:signal transduction histidine kinase/CheY-like chemotaxis protein
MLNYKASGRPLGILVAAAMLIALTWLGTLNAVSSQHAEAEARVAAAVANQAVVFEEQLQRQLLEIDQTLRILARAAEDDPGHFDLLAWRRQLVLLDDVSPFVFMADAAGTVRQSTMPEAIGLDVRDRDYFRDAAGQASGDEMMFIGPVTQGLVFHRWHVNLARRLHHADGSFAGVIVAGLSTSTLARFYQIANVGQHGMIAVVGMAQGRVRVAAGPDAVEPGTDISQSDMFRAIQASPNGGWTGRSATDGVERVHGFHQLGARKLELVVAVDRSEAMSSTTRWEIAAHVFAASITLLLVLMTGILLLEVQAARRRQAMLARDHMALEAAHVGLESAKARADAKTAQLEATLAGMSDGVAMVDADLRLVEWNPHFPDIAGVPDEVLRIGLPMEDILRAQARAGQFGKVDIEAEVARRIAVLRSGGFAENAERTRPDGRILELRRNGLPDGGFVTLYTDITDRKQVENTLREARTLAEIAAQAMSRFVAIVSHEIRTPLNALLNSLTLLADSDMAAPQRALLNMARQSGDALMPLINDVLEMSRMEAGQLALRPNTFTLRALIESALEMFGGQAAARRIALRLSIAPGVPDQIHEDPGRLRQVLINLLSNAVKFADPGEVRVVVALRLDRAGMSLRISVRDRGPVIPEAARVQLFEPFSRLEDGGGETPHGTGLGLTICRHLVALMDGEIGCSIWTVGRRDAGNEFWFTLPVKPPSGDARAALMQTDPQTRQRLPRTRILLVEDILASQLVTAMLLRREGHMVDVALNAQEAISAVTSRPYDLVFMDIFMPGMNGLDATRHIRSMAGPAAGLAIVALTANASPDNQALCAAAGMNGVLGKPVALRELLDVLAIHVWPHCPNRAAVPTDTTAVATASSPVLSSARLDELRANLPPDMLASLIEGCLADLSERLPSLMEALREGAAEPVIAQAHAMAGMAAEYGMAMLEARVRAVMQLAHGDTGSAAEMAEELEAEMSRAATALRAAVHGEMV